MREALPFALGLLFITAQPILDRTWLLRLRQKVDPDNRDDTLTPAKWVADVAQFLPSASLTVVGIALALPRDTGSATLIAFVAVSLLLSLVIYIAASTMGKPGVSRKSPWSWLQLVLAGLNVVGIYQALS